MPVTLAPSKGMSCAWVAFSCYFATLAGTSRFLIPAGIVCFSLLLAENFVCCLSACGYDAFLQGIITLRAAVSKGFQGPPAWPKWTTCMHPPSMHASGKPMLACLPSCLMDLHNSMLPKSPGMLNASAHSSSAVFSLNVSALLSRFLSEAGWSLGRLMTKLSVTASIS